MSFVFRITAALCCLAAQSALAATIPGHFEQIVTEGGGRSALTLDDAGRWVRVLS